MNRLAQIGPTQLFTLAFGTIAGIAWLFLTGPWLTSAGSIGTVVALAAGAAIMLPIVVVYAALARRIPGGGGEILYAGAAFGEGLAFLAGWILVACYISLVAFILITVAWLVDVCLTNIGREFDRAVPGTRMTGIVVSAAAFAIVIMANYRGVRVAARLQDVIIALKLMAVIGLASLAVALGDTANLAPHFAGSPADSLRGIASVLVAAPFLYAGFNTAVQAMAEIDMRRLHLVRRAFLAAVFCAAAFYAMIVLSVAMAMPRATLLAEELPALSGLAAALGSPLAATFVAAIALLALAGCWNGVLLAGCKVLAELARRGHLPAWLQGAPTPSGRQARVLLVIVVSALALTALGRDAVLVTVSTVSFFMSLAFAIACVSLWRLAPDPAAPAERALAAIGAALSVGLIVLALHEMLSADGLSPALLLVVGWLVAGTLLLRRHNAQALE